MYEKNREANALAEISRKLAAAARENAASHLAKPSSSDKRAKERNQDAVLGGTATPALDASLHAATAGAPAHTTSKNTDDVAMKDVEPAQQCAQQVTRPVPETTMEPVLPPVEPEATDVDAAFTSWYLTRIGEGFEEELEGFQSGEGGVHPRKMLQALTALGSSLYTPQEKKAAISSSTASITK